MADLKVDQLEFLSSLPEFLHTKCAQTECSILLEEPRLTSCCGNHFCQRCIAALSGRPCSICGESFVSVPDKNLQRAISACRIRCLNKNEGCKWEGEVRYLREHLSAAGDCQFVVLSCSLECGFSALRPLVSSHELSECLKRSVSCRHCVEFRSSWEKMQEHEDECPEALVTCPNACDEKIKRRLLSSHKTECPLEEVCCEFAYAGCKWSGIRRAQESHHHDQWKEHISAATTTHSQLIETHKSAISLLTQNVDSQEQHINQLADELARLEMELSKTPETEASEGDVTLTTIAGISKQELFTRRVSFTFVSYDFSHERNQDGFVKTQPFFTGNPGYRMKLRVYLGGKGSGRRTHISVYNMIVNGPRDDELIWPFYGSVTIQLCSWQNRAVCYPRVIHYGKNLPLKYTRQTSDWGDVTTEWGIDQFIAHDEIDAFIEDGSLLFEVSEVTVPRLRR